MKDLAWKRKVRRWAAELEKLDQFAVQARIGQLMIMLMRRSSTVIVHRDDAFDEDLDNISAERTCSVTAFMDGIKESRVRTTFLDALESLLDKERKKRCAACKKRSPISHFCYDSSRPDGRFPYCRVCQRGKMNRANKKKRCNSQN